MCLGARVQEFLIRLEYLLLLSHRVTHLGTSLVAQWLKEKKKKKPACKAGDAKDSGSIPSQGRRDPLNKGMATHSSILAWRISRTEEPGGLQSMGLQRVEHS